MNLVTTRSTPYWEGGGAETLILVELHCIKVQYLFIVRYCAASACCLCRMLCVLSKTSYQKLFAMIKGQTLVAPKLAKKQTVASKTLHLVQALRSDPQNPVKLTLTREWGPKLGRAAKNEKCPIRPCTLSRWSPVFKVPQSPPRRIFFVGPRGK